MTKNNYSTTKLLGLGILIVTIVAMLSIGDSLQPVSAYEADTHYYWTFFLALYAGFDWSEAHLLASGDQRMDETKLVADWFRDGHIITPNPNNADWHALNTVTGERDARFDTLKNRGLDETNNEMRLVKFGQFLHFQQDMEPHEGYGSLAGHFSAGHKPDSPAASVEKFKKTTIVTLNVLRDLCLNIGKQTCQSTTIQNIPADIQPVIDGIVGQSSSAAFWPHVNYGQTKNQITIEKAIASLKDSVNLDVPPTVELKDGRYIIPHVMNGEFNVTSGANRGEPIASTWIINEDYLKSFPGMVEAKDGFKFPDGSIQRTSHFGSSLWTPSEDGIYHMTSNVGIGTATPERSFHIRGDVIRLDRDSPNPEFMFTFWDYGYNNLWKTFSMGMHATSENNGYFYFADRGTTVGGPGKITRLVINNDGNVGIGTDNPNNKLVIANNNVNGVSIELRSADDTSGNYDYSTARILADFSGPLWSDSTLHLQTATGADTWKDGLVVKDGNVGIGTDNPIKAKLVVTGNGIDQNLTYAYITTANDNVNQIGGTYTTGYSIYADGFVAGIEFHNFSDERIKEFIGVSDGVSDLDTLNKIQITDYTFKDPRKGNDVHKKVIGQQIQQVYPQAINLGTDIINDIMENANIVGNTIYLEGHGLSSGDIVNMVFEDDNSEGTYEILAITQDSFNIDANHKGGVFITGQQVDDFHYVDYDALSMLTISAVQEQQKIIDKQQDILEQLKSVICPDHLELTVCQENN